MEYLELTDRDHIKVRAGVKQDTWDNFIDGLVVTVTAQIQNRLRRFFKKQTFVERHTLRAWGRSKLWLDQGPILMNNDIPPDPDVTVEYLSGFDDQGDEEWTELTYPRQFTVDGLLSEGSRSTGRVIFRWHELDHALSLLPLGMRVTYVAGWETTGTAPKVWPVAINDLHDFATRWGAHLFKTREVYGMTGKDLGEGSITPTAQTEFEEAIDQELYHWRSAKELVQ